MRHRDYRQYRDYPHINDREHHPQVSIGIFFIVLGIALLIASNDLLKLGSFSSYFTWETAMVFIGVLLLLNLQFTGGLLLIAGGIWFLQEHILFLTPEIFKTFYWPAVIVLIGLSFIISSLFKRKKKINKLETNKFTIMETNENYRDERRQARDERHQLRHEDHHLQNNRAIIGVILVLAGLFLVMRNTGFFPDFIDHVIFSWPMLLVTIGLVITLGSSGGKTSGIIVMAVGAFFLLPQIFRETFNVDMFWPSIFIIIGVIFIFTKRKGWNSVNTGPVVGDDYIDYVHVFSGGERQIVSENFRGGKVTAIFGGSEIDLTKAKLAPGVSELEIACVFGGATIIVPDDWNVKIEVVPVLGGFGDSRKLLPGRTVDTTRQLVIKGAVVFGGGEIKSY